jgi:hypothetical protein
MKRIPFSLLMIFSIVLGACATGSAPQQESTITPGTSAPPELPIVQLPETDRPSLLFQIRNHFPAERERVQNWLDGAEILQSLDGVSDR